MPRITQNDQRQQTGPIPSQLDRIQRQTGDTYGMYESLDVSGQGDVQFSANARSAFDTGPNLALELLNVMKGATDIAKAVSKAKDDGDRELSQDLQMAADKIIANPDLSKEAKLIRLNAIYSTAKPLTDRYEAIFSNQAAGAEAELNELNDDDSFLEWVNMVNRENRKNPVISVNPDIPSKTQFKQDAIKDAKIRFPRLTSRIDNWAASTEEKDYQKQYNFIYKFATSQATNELNLLALEKPEIFTDDMGGLNNIITSTVFNLAKENGIPVERIRDDDSIMQDIQFLIKGKTQEVQRIKTFESDINTAQKLQQDLMNKDLQFDDVLSMSDLSPAAMFKSWVKGRELLAPQKRNETIYTTWSGIQDIKKMQFNVRSSDSLFTSITKYHPKMYEGKEEQELVAQLIEDPLMIDIQFRGNNKDVIQSVIEQTSNLYANDFMKSLSDDERETLLSKIGEDGRKILQPSPTNDASIATPFNLRQQNIVRSALTPEPTSLDLRTMKSLSQTVNAVITSRLKDLDGESSDDLTDLMKKRDEANFDNQKPTETERQARAELGEEFADITITPEDQDEESTRAADALMDLNTGFNASNEEDGSQTLIGYSLVAQRYNGSVSKLNEWLDFWESTNKNPKSSEFNEFYNQRYDESTDFDFTSITDPVNATVGELRELQQRFPDDPRLNGMLETYDGTDDSKDRASDFLLRFDSLVKYLDNPDADDPLVEYAVELKAKREALLQNMSKNVAAESDLYDYKNGIITLTKDNNVAVPFLLADAASQFANNGAYNDGSAGVLAERMEQVGTSYQQAATSPEGKANWFKQNENIMATLMSLSGTNGFSFSDNKILKNATFGLLGSFYGLSSQTVTNMQMFTPENNPRGSVFNEVITNRLGPLIEAVQNEDGSTTANIANYIDKAYTQVTDIRHKNLKIEIGTLDFNNDPAIISHNFSPWGESLFGSTWSWIGREIGGPVAEASQWFEVDPYQPIPSAENMYDNRLTTSLGSSATLTPKDRVDVEQGLRDLIVKNIFNYNNGLLVQQAGQDGALSTAFEAGLFASDNTLTSVGSPINYSVISTAKHSGVGFGVAILPNANEETNVFSRAMGFKDGDRNPHEVVIVPRVSKGTTNDDPTSLVIPVAITPEYQQAFDKQLELWPFASSLDTDVKNQNLVLSNMTAPANSEDLINKRFFNRVEQDGFKLTSEQSDKVLGIVKKVLHERGNNRGPANRIRTHGGMMSFGRNRRAMEYGPSYFGLHGASTLLSYLERAIKDDTLDFDAIVTDIEKDLETIDPGGGFRMLPRNNIISFARYNSNDGSYENYIKQGDGVMPITGDEVMGISSPSEYLDFVADGGIRTFVPLDTSTRGSHDFNPNNPFVIQKEFIIKRGNYENRPRILLN